MRGRESPMPPGRSAFPQASWPSRQRRRPSWKGCGRLGRPSCRSPTTRRGRLQNRTPIRGSTAPSSTLRQSRFHRRSWHDGSGDCRGLSGRPHGHLRDRGGGLISGVGSAIKALRPDATVLGAEPETAAPYALSLREGAPQKYADWEASFVDGAGGKSVTERMWDRMGPVTDGSIVVTLDQTAKAMRLIAEKTRTIAEGLAVSRWRQH
ncbi:pyridoxal-phosphate dependent enzyme [Sphingomonas daechungensis]|uniref:pyridoxal-phosphate dependent enzyme n=1 Tax=Sphingomonas daechungensis TaxID=1176646 RepID=UPI0037D9E7B6